MNLIRRIALGAATSILALTSYAQQPSANDSRFMDSLDQRVGMIVPRTRSYKWGGHIKTQQYCFNPLSGINLPAYRITGENEEAAACLSPSHRLSTILSVNSGTPQITWSVDSSKSDFVNAALDPDAIILYMKKDNDGGSAQPLMIGGSPFMLNNQRIANDDPFFPTTPLILASAENAAQLGLNVSDIATSCQYPAAINAEQEQMHTWLHGEADPWGNLQVYPVDVAPDGHGIYKVVLSARDENNKRGAPLLSGTFNYSTGDLARIDSESTLHGKYGKIFVALYDQQGFWIKKYGIDTEGQAHSKVYMPEVEALAGAPVPAPKAPPPAQPPVQQPSAPVPSDIKDLQFTCAAYEGGPACTQTSDEVSGSCRSFAYTAGTASMKVLACGKPDGASPALRFEFYNQSRQTSADMVACAYGRCIGGTHGDFGTLVPTPAPIVSIAEATGDLKMDGPAQ